jgi:lipopolysaccharide heptosyltransferase I
MQRFRPLAASDRLLIVRLGAVGDVLRAIPAVHAIRSAFPRLHVSWIVEDLSFPLVDGHPDVDQTLRFPRRELGAWRRPGVMAENLALLRTTLRSQAFTVVLDLQASFKSGLLTWLTGAARRVGFSPAHSREMSFVFTNEWVRLTSRWLNRVDRNLELAQAVGASIADPGLPLPERPEEGEEAEALLRRLLPGSAPRVLVSPGASRRQAHKRWPASGFARLAASLRREQSTPLVVVWGPGEEELARSVDAASQGGALLAPATSLRILAAMLRRSTLFVAADTGPMHLAWAVGCPVVALFGPTDPRLNAPLGTGHRVLRASSGRMEDLDPRDVLEAVRQALAGRRTPAAGLPAGPVVIGRGSRGQG